MDLHHTCGVVGQFGITNDIILFIGHYDLYFMVQLFNLIPLTLFNR